MEQTLNILKNTKFEMLLFGLLALAICLGISRILMRLFTRLLDRSRYIDASLHSVLKSMLRILLYFISIVFAASIMGIPITSFVALFSVVGLAVSLAVQGVLSNLAGGVIILASKPFTLGDYIETDAVSGTVNEINFLHTRMISPDGKIIFVPNSLLYNSKLINYTSSGTRRIDVSLRMAYDCSPEMMRKALLPAARGLTGVLDTPQAQLLLENYSKNGIDYILRLWVRSQDYMNVRYALNEAIYSALAQAGIRMSYPHLHIHMQDAQDPNPEVSNFTNRA